MNKNIFITGLCVLVLYSSSSFSVEPDRGQLLYDNHCRACHESWMHTRPDRRVSSLSELRQRVKSWSIHSELNWRNSDIDAVTDYLSRNFYQLSDQP